MSEFGGVNMNICSACGEQGHLLCGVIGKDWRDAKITSLQNDKAELSKRVEELDNFCKEFVYGEENPEYYKTMDKKIEDLEKKLAEYENGKGACLTCESVGMLNKELEKKLKEANFLIDKIWHDESGDLDFIQSMISKHYGQALKQIRGEV